MYPITKEWIYTDLRNLRFSVHDPERIIYAIWLEHSTRDSAVWHIATSEPADYSTSHDDQTGGFEIYISPDREDFCYGKITVDPLHYALAEDREIGYRHNVSSVDKDLFYLHVYRITDNKPVYTRPR